MNEAEIYQRRYALLALLDSTLKTQDMDQYDLVLTVNAMRDLLLDFENADIILAAEEFAKQTAKAAD